MPVDPTARGTLIVSLDFELHWGVRDVKTVAQYRENLLGVRRAIPALLATFADYGIHATWATVGFLFFANRVELLSALPGLWPRYDDPRLSPYPDLERVLGRDELEDPFHFGRSLLEQIRSYPAQEIGTHTFSHYYCLEPTQDLAVFRADLEASFVAAARIGIKLASVVFPRNQYDRDHLRICGEMGLKAFRGNPASWAYHPRSGRGETRRVRAVRLLDSYCDLSSHNCYPLAEVARELPFNLRASRFLRPRVTLLPWAQSLQERRIKGDLTHAAEHGLVYHVWWHPHNFGLQLEQNMKMLRRVLDHFQTMHNRYGMRSMNMGEVANLQLSSSEIREHAVKENNFAGERR